MKKLNRKGYLTIEIIIASVIAFTVAFFLMEITINLVDITDTEYVDTNFMTDKALIMKNIKKSINEDIETYGKVNSITCTNSTTCEINYNTKIKKIIINNEENQNQITYTEDNNTAVYTKKVDSNYGNMTINGGILNNYIYIQIKGNNIFSDEEYNINIIIYNG